MLILFGFHLDKSAKFRIEESSDIEQYQIINSLLILSFLQGDIANHSQKFEDKDSDINNIKVRL